MVINKKRISKNLLVLIGLVFVIFFPYIISLELDRNIRLTESKIEIWQEDLSKAFTNKNWLFVAKISNTLFSNEMKWIKVFHNEEPIFSLPSEDINKSCFIGHTFQVKHYGINLGQIDVCYSLSKFLSNSITNNLFISYFCAILFLIASMVVFSLYRYKSGLLEFIKNMELHANNKDSDPQLAIKTNDNLLKKLLDMINSNIEYRLSTQKAKDEVDKLQVLNKMARQVSHDIRSPLAVLNMIVRQNLRELPEEKRVVIRQQIERIQDIANNLLAKNKDATASNISKSDVKTTRVELLSSVIEEIITEKRLYFRSKLGITIEGDIYDSNSYGLFAKINLTEFKRILSNLINNAAEAFNDSNGKIVIKLYSNSNESIEIVVEDNGKGIPSEILSKLGNEGASFGKEKNSESGNGLGLYHARTTVENFGGKFKIESEVGKGTKMIIVLPRESAPAWFVPKLVLKNGQAVVILDDDQGIHHTWDNRFKEFNLCEQGIEVIHLSNPNDFRAWVSKESYRWKEVLYLSDFELLGFKETGLDLLEEQKIKNAILVTSHYENESIRERCDKLGVRLIPKMLAGFVPISVSAIENVDLKGTGYYDYIYIDDDQWLRMGWDMAAKKKNLNIVTLSTTRDFDQYRDKISKEYTSIYLDRNLGENEMKGDEFAKILYQEGYKNINLATGEDAESFKHLSWLKVSGKDCPFEDKDSF